MNIRRTIGAMLVGVFVVGATPAHADLDADLAGVAAAYHQDKQAEEAKRQALLKAQQAAAAKRAEAARLAQEKKDRLAAEEKAERMADKKREQAYEDRKREIELQAAELNLLEEKKLELEMKRAKVKRADEFIDAELARDKAATDVIQSTADANRTLSGAAREKLEKAEAEAEAKKEKESKFLGIF